MSALENFIEISEREQFKGWPMIGKPKLGKRIHFFGQELKYKLQTGNGPEDYTSIIRQFGWAECFGITKDRNVVTLVQWKPGVNQASWEIPPGGIGKIDPNTPIEEIKKITQNTYLKETGYVGDFEYLGHVVVETGKYRGAGPNDHGLPAYLFLARELKKMANTRKPNRNEIMETLMVPLEEFPEVLNSGLFVEISAVVCAYKALTRLGLLR